jgi:SPOR domain
MAEVSKSRLSLDLEDIERQLRRSSPGAASSKSDPLAELARIVGQDDPFRALLAEEGPGSQRPGSGVGGRREPLFDYPGSEQGGATDYGSRGNLADDDRGYPEAYRQPPVALTREEEAILYGHGGHSYAGDAHDHGRYYDDAGDGAEVYEAFAPEPPRRRRKVVMAAAATVAVVALAGVGVWTLRSGGPSGLDGDPPVVKAETGPSKIAPQNPGGIDIPNQNKKIYEPGAQDTQTRVVNREEQPIDLRQAIRAGAPAPDSASGTAPVRLSPAVPANVASGVAPSLQGSGNAIAGFLGEPRRVRTVSIRPDGTVIPPDAGAAARSAVAAPPAAAAPDPRAAATSGALALPPSLRPRDATPPATAPRSASGAAPDQSVGAPLQITPDSARPKSEPRLAAAPPAAVREPTETSAAPAASPGFTVQLGVRGTDREARHAFEQFQQRHAGDLSGFSPLIVQAEIDGKTAYRVRVGPMSRNDATSLCVRLKASGGQCFVANN